MSNKLYVTNVPVLIDLPALFGPYGTVLGWRTASVAGPDGPGKAALVEMGSAQEVAEAILALDGRLHEGHTLGVCAATPRHESAADHTSLFGPMNMTADKREAALLPGNGGARMASAAGRGTAPPELGVPAEAPDQDMFVQELPVAGASPEAGAGKMHAWFSVESASRTGSSVYRKPSGATVNVTRVGEERDGKGSYPSDEKYLGEVVATEDGGCVRGIERVRGMSDR